MRRDIGVCSNVRERETVGKKERKQEQNMIYSCEHNGLRNPISKLLLQ